MASTKVKGIVLGGVNIKEKDKLVNLYTLEEGKITVSFKGVRGEKAKLKACKEIFCFGEFVIERSGASNIVTSCEIIDNFFALSKDIEKYYEGCAILDILNKTAFESNPALFIETIKALKSLCYDSVPKFYIIDKFLLSFFNLSGYHFLSDKCASCQARLGQMYFDYDLGALVCPACKRANCDLVTPSAFMAMKILYQTDYEKLPTVKLGGGGEVQAYHILSKNFEWKVGVSIIRII